MVVGTIKHINRHLMPGVSLEDKGQAMVLAEEIAELRDKIKEKRGLPR